MVLLPNSKHLPAAMQTFTHTHTQTNTHTVTPVGGEEKQTDRYLIVRAGTIIPK